MTRTILGGYVLEPSEIYATIGTVTILKTNERIHSKDVRLILMRCEACKEPVTDKREAAFAKQTGMCYQCCTGNVLDFCHRSICRTIPDTLVPKAKHWLMHLCPMTTTFWTQPWERNSAYTELHWSYEPWEGFIRVGYHIFRVLNGLTRAEITASMHDAIYKGVRENARLTRSAYSGIGNVSSHSSDDRGHSQ